MLISTLIYFTAVIACKPPPCCVTTNLIFTAMIGSQLAKLIHGECCEMLSSSERCLQGKTVITRKIIRKFNIFLTSELLWSCK